MDRTLSGVACLPGEVSSTHARSWAIWLIPDLASTLSLITVFVCLFLFDGTRTLFRDSDSGWHIRTGESILAGYGLPRTDSFSMTRSGEPWFAWEWGADVLMGAAHKLGGLAGVAALYALVLAGTTWLWFRLHRVCGGNLLFAGACATLFLSTGYLHWLARPHLFGWLFLVGFVLYLESGSRRLWLAVLLMIGWTNVHASFFLGPLIACLYALGFGLKTLIWDVDGAEHWRQVKWYSGVAAVCGLATFANPYGFGLHKHLAQYLGNSQLLARIGEYQSFNFHAEGSSQILIMLGVASFGTALALLRGNLPHFFLGVLFLGLALRSARTIPIAALLVLPLANSEVARALAGLNGLRPSIARSIKSFFEYSSNLDRIDRSVKGWPIAVALIVFLLILVQAPAIASRVGFPEEQFPVAVARKVEALPSAARLLAPDMYGGYLIYRFSGQRKVFFDGRSDFYGSEYMKAYLELIEVRPGWQQHLERHRFTHALLPNRYSLIPALEQLGWKKTYSDPVATLLEKP